jgi:signal transduction histidine kinase
MLMLARLILIAVVAILPALGINAYNAYELREARVQEFRRQGLRDAESIGRELDRLISGIRASLLLVANSQDVRSNEPGVCRKILHDTVQGVGMFDSLSLTDAKGRVICSSISPEPLGNDLSDRVAYQLVLEKQDFVVGSFVVGRGNGKRQLNLGFPVKDKDGLFGVLFAGVDVDWLAREMQNIPVSARGSVTIADRFGTILLRFPESYLVGASMRQEMQWSLDGDKAQVVEIVGRDGERRFSAFLPLRTRPYDIFVAVGLSRAEALAPIDSAVRRAFILAFLGLLIAAIFAVLIGRQFIEKPVRSLLEATFKWREGDRSVRIATEDMPREFASIGEAFNRLVHAVDVNEQALRRSVSEMRSIYDSAPVGLAVIDRNLNYLSANARLTAADPMRRAVVGANMRDTVPYLLDRVGPLLEKVFATGEPVINYELHHGARSWVCNYFPVKSDHGEVLAVSIAALETTEISRTEQALARSEAWVKLAQESASIGTWDWDLASGELRWSDQQFRLHGLTPRGETQSFAAREWYDCVRADNRHALDAGMGAAITTKDRYEVDYRIEDKESGEIRWIATRGRVILNEAGQATRVTGVSFDISERHRSRELLEAANAELEMRVAARTRELVEEVRERERAQAQLFQAQKTESLGQLTGGIAHDFNNLLAAILSSLQLMKKRLPDDGRTQRYLDNALRAAQRGAVLTQRMLAFARKQDLKPETVDVKLLVEGMQDLLQSSIGPQVRIQTQFAASLRPVAVDAHQLELAILNVAVNARDAMPEGGTLFIEGDEQHLGDRDFVRITLRDTGTGMDDATLARATEPFFTTKAIGKGTGLGLSMVQGLAAQSGGHMNVKSRLTEGTVVELWLPPAATQSLSPSPPALAAPKTQSPRLSVLVVDDDPLVLMGTVDMLDDLGHEVVETSSASEALQILKTRSFDIVLTDQAMPMMTGTELARELSYSHPDLPVVLVTGYADLPKDTPATLARLSKPFTQADLDEILRDNIRDKGKVVPLRR